MSSVSVYEVLTFPDPRLRQTAVEVETVTDEIRAIAKKMLDTMYADGGVGLASIQVNVLHRIVVADCSSERNKPQPYIFINPKITKAEGYRVREEACLSFPGVCVKVDRADKVRCEYIDEHGKPQVIETEGLLAHCIQHEIDHLNGKLMVDYLSPLKLQMVRRKIEKYARVKEQHRVF